MPSEYLIVITEKMILIQRPPFTGWIGCLDKNRMPRVLSKYGKGGKYGSHLDGPQRTWVNGVKKSIENFKDGMKHGLFINFFNTGQVFSGGYYLKDRKEGLWAEWQDGRIYKINRYEKGVLHGVSISYQTEGTENIDIYQNGRKISERRWFSEVRGKGYKYLMKEWHPSGFFKSKGQCLKKSVLENGYSIGMMEVLISG